MRQFLCVPTINVLSKNKKKDYNVSPENYNFYSHEILLYITWACYRDVEKHQINALFLFKVDALRPR